MNLPDGFVYLKNINPTIIQDVKYATDDNFIGRPIQGYESPLCILTQQAAEALSLLQEKLLQDSLSLKIFDAYRPQTAVTDFLLWSHQANDQKMKSQFYPNINKADFFSLGYLALKSSHTCGSTVDLTLVRLNKNRTAHTALEMGTQFDFMDERSHALNEDIPLPAQKNRMLLRQHMQAAGFEPYDKEWWHFTLKNEPFPDTYFDFYVK